MQINQPSRPRSEQTKKQQKRIYNIPERDWWGAGGEKGNFDGQPQEWRRVCLFSTMRQWLPFRPLPLSGLSERRRRGGWLGGLLLLLPRWYRKTQAATCAVAQRNQGPNCPKPTPFLHCSLLLLPGGGPRLSKLRHHKQTNCLAPIVRFQSLFLASSLILSVLTLCLPLV